MKVRYQIMNRQSKIETFFLENTKPMLSHINVGTGSDVTIMELAEMIKSVVGFLGTITFDKTKPDGAPRKLLDVTKIHKLGWRSTTELNEGLTKSYEDYFIRHARK